MTKNDDINSAVEKLLEFAEFFLNLGDLSGHDMRIAIGERDPAFTWYIDTVTTPIDTVIDFLRVYGDWGIEQVRKQCVNDWDEVKNACFCSQKYQTLSKRWKDNTVLWDLLQEIMGK